MLTNPAFIGFAITAQPEAAKAFYGDVLGLRLIEENDFALVFDAHGAPLRLQKLDEAPPPAATTLGWQVSDIAGAVLGLITRGVAFERFGGLDQDDLGIWTTPDGSRVAWFRDPDGNRLSLTEFAGAQIPEQALAQAPAQAPPPAPAEPPTPGEAVRRKVLGDAHVDRAIANTTAFDADFQAFITAGAWGGVWARPGLNLRERSLLTLALLAALGHHDEVSMHVRATANTGATPDDVKEALLHVAVYAGVPAANAAFKIAKAAYAEMEKGA